VGDFPNVLVPFDRREAISLRTAAKIAGRSETTVRGWCAMHGIGRRIVGGPWQVSRVALAMLLEGSEGALRAYHAGDREGPLVHVYFVRFGLNGPAEATKVAEATEAAA
jgi:hypothetical protein